MSNEEKLNRISDIILRHMKNKYPNSFEQTGLNQEHIISILQKKQEILNNKEGLSYIINIIDNVVRTRINGPNNILKNMETSQITQDSQTTIPYSKYVNQNLDTNTQPSFKIDNTLTTKNNDTLADSNFKDGGIIQTYKEENILDDRMNSKYFDNSNNNHIQLFIDSKDRDFENFENANNYELDLTEKALNRVKSIKLNNVILIDSSKTEMSSDNLTLPPYLILEIDGLPNKTSGYNCGSNKYTDKAFAVLNKYELQNGFKYYTIDKETGFREYNNTFSLNKIKIKFRLPDGSLFNFGNANDDLRTTVNFLDFTIKLE